MPNQWIRITAGKYAGRVVPVRKGPPEKRPAGIRNWEPRVNSRTDEPNAKDIPKYMVLHAEVLGLPVGWPCWVRAHECELLPEAKCRDLDLQHNLAEMHDGHLIG